MFITDVFLYYLPLQMLLLLFKSLLSDHQIRKTHVSYKRLNLLCTCVYIYIYIYKFRARCSSVVRAFAHGVMGRRFDPS